MKYLIVLISFVLLGCAPVKPSGCSMNYSCGNNSRCAASMGNWASSGFFQTEQDCLVWETAFINSYSGSSVTSCSCN